MKHYCSYNLVLKTLQKVASSPTWMLLTPNSIPFHQLAPHPHWFFLSSFPLPAPSPTPKCLPLPTASPLLHVGFPPHLLLLPCPTHHYPTSKGPQILIDSSFLAPPCLPPPTPNCLPLPSPPPYCFSPPTCGPASPSTSLSLSHPYPTSNKTKGGGVEQNKLDQVSMLPLCCYI